MGDRPACVLSAATAGGAIDRSSTMLGCCLNGDHNYSAVQVKPAVNRGPKTAGHPAASTTRQKQQHQPQHITSRA